MAVAGLREAEIVLTGEPDEAPPVMPNRASVAGPGTPSAPEPPQPWDRWNAATAARVSDPKSPVGPEGMDIPRAMSARCIALMWEPLAPGT